MKIDIKSRYTGEVIFSREQEGNTIKITVEAAIRGEASLRGANLCDADLCDANLRDANLCGANLYGANLCGADLRDANLCGANLCGADLCGANLCGANLYGANLYGANLCGADLCGANLCGADLYGANLCGAVIYNGAKCDGLFHHLTNVGSERGTLELYSCGDFGWFVKRGCFNGALQEFVDAVDKKHGDNKHGKIYMAIIYALCGYGEK